MKTQISWLRRRLLRPLLTVVVAAGLAFSLSGCPFLVALIVLSGETTLFENVPLTFSLSPDEAAQTGSFDVTASFAVLAPGPSFTLEGSSISLSSSDGQSPTGVVLSAENFDTPGRVTFHLDVAGAGARPFSVNITFTYLDEAGVLSFGVPDLIRTYSGSAVFFVHTTGGGNAPRLTGITPFETPRGVLAPIQFAGVNFDSIATFSAEYGLTISDVQDAGAGRVTAILDLPESVPTGELRLFVETAAGRSNSVGIQVIAERPDPVLTGLFPNHGAADAVTEVAVAGRHIITGAQVITAPGSEALLSRGLLVQPPFVGIQDFRPLGAPRVESVRVDALGRLSNTADFHVEAPGFRGPRIVSISPRRALAGVQSQFEITWENLTNAEAPQLIGLRNLQFSQPLLSSTVLTAQEQPARAKSIAVIEVGAASERGDFHFAAQTPDGRTTNLRLLGINPIPPTGPYVQRATTGRIVRDGVARADTIIGQRLTGVSRVDSATPGLEVVSFTEVAGGASLGVMVRAEPTTPLTGDVRTVFNVYLAAGGISNEFSYIVEDGTVNPPGGPILDAIFPNFAYPDGTRPFFDVTGENLQNPFELLVTPAGSIGDTYDLATNSPRNNALLISLLVNFPATTNSLSLTVTTAGGTLTSNALPIAVLDPANPTGPVILSVSPDTLDVVADSTFQFLIRGMNFGVAGPTALVRFARGNDDPIRSVRLFSPSTPGAAESSVVVQFDIGPATGGLTEFAVQAGTLVSSLVGISYTEPVADEPFVSRTAVGAITREQSVPETIRGARLTNVTDVVFAQPGITVSNIEQSTDGGASFTATFTAADNAVLTGDAVTTFYVETDGGALRSNNSGYIVQP